MNNNSNNYLHLYGNAEGTTYSIIYNDKKNRNLKLEINSILMEIEQSLSVYNNDSLISRINRNEEYEVDNYFTDVFLKAKDVYEKTNGMFDISAEPLFKAWGFSFQNREEVSKLKIAELRNKIGLDKIWIDERKLTKINSYIVLNMNAIAKGYSVDVIADYFVNQDIHDFLIEIGGEIRLKGVNKEGKQWLVGVDKPVYGNHIPGRQIQTYLQLSNKAIATSGEYRRFYVDDNGNRYSHTINPKTGYPVKHNLRSVTVIADDAISADAYATAFMVMGVKDSLKYLEKYANLDAMFIYEEENSHKIKYSTNIENYIR